MPASFRPSRRSSLIGLGTLGAAALAGGVSPAALAALSAAEPPPQPTDLRREIFARVWATPLIDTHEHLVEEKERLAGWWADDFSLLLTGYLGSDLISAGMPRADRDRLFSRGPSPAEKWKLLAPWWPAVRHTGYGLAARLSFRELYGIDDLSAATVEKAQEAYARTRRTGFYEKILRQTCRIESCQVNSLSGPFCQTEMPTLLMQDIAVHPWLGAPGTAEGYAQPGGLPVATLDDWLRVLDWWFDRFGARAVAIKSADAYRRDINYRRTPAGQVAETYRQVAAGQKVVPEARKALEDHLFWHAVDRATSLRLPVKVHLGYYAGENFMPLARVRDNCASACDLCRTAPDARFVFMHIAWPYDEELLAVAKQYANAHVDMCWAWIMNPATAKDFLKKYLVTAPANKLLVFGGDYLQVEQVVGHALIARHGVALALCELVEEGWLSRDDALALIDPLLHGNARRIFRLEEKAKVLAGG